MDPARQAVVGRWAGCGWEIRQQQHAARRLPYHPPVRTQGQPRRQAGAAPEVRADGWYRAARPTTAEAARSNLRLRCRTSAAQACAARGACGWRWASWKVTATTPSAPSVTCTCTAAQARPLAAAACCTHTIWQLGQLWQLAAAVGRPACFAVTCCVPGLWSFFSLLMAFPTCCLQWSATAAWAAACAYTTRTTCAGATWARGGCCTAIASASCRQYRKPWRHACPPRRPRS